MTQNYLVACPDARARKNASFELLEPHERQTMNSQNLESLTAKLKLGAGRSAPVQMW